MRKIGWILGRKAGYEYGVEAHEKGETGAVELHGMWPNTQEGALAARKYGEELIEENPDYYGVVMVVRIETPSVWVIQDPEGIMAA